jgi:serine/threonine protein kinase
MRSLPGYRRDNLWKIQNANGLAIPFAHSVLGVHGSGEGGRSDIFSLGVAFYELLTGRKPFRGDTHAQVLEQILRNEERPPRQIDDTIPRELERICQKMLAKRASERYSTARDLAGDTPKRPTRSHETDLSPISARVQKGSAEARVTRRLSHRTCCGRGCSTWG